MMCSLVITLELYDTLTYVTQLVPQFVSHVLVVLQDICAKLHADLRVHVHASL